MVLSLLWEVIYLDKSNPLLLCQFSNQTAANQITRKRLAESANKECDGQCKKSSKKTHFSFLKKKKRPQRQKQVSNHLKQKHPTQNKVSLVNKALLIVTQTIQISKNMSAEELAQTVKDALQQFEDAFAIHGNTKSNK